MLFIFQISNQETVAGIVPFWTWFGSTSPHANSIISIKQKDIISHKITETFLCFSIVFVHHKQNGARLLSPEVECTIYLTYCPMTKTWIL